MIQKTWISKALRGDGRDTSWFRTSIAAEIFRATFLSADKLIAVTREAHQLELVQEVKT